MKIEQNLLIHKTLGFSIKEVDEENHIIRGVFSTGESDRHGEVVDQSGWDLKHFLKNPVILFAHDHWTPAVGQGVDIKVVNGQLEGGIKFAVEEDESGLAKTLFQLYAKKFMRAFSVGFMNTKYEVTEDEDDITLLENTLYEISCVNVGANATALAKSAGVDVGALDKLSGQKTKEVVLADASIDQLGKKIAGEIKKTKKVKRADKSTTKPTKKVETPKAKGSRYSNRNINKAVRQLLKKKKTKIYSKT